jgi:hypothetical protein
MGKFNQFINKDQENCEKLYGTYGCKYCEEDLDHAWWDVNKSMFFWICSNGHRSEHHLV